MGMAKDHYDDLSQDDQTKWECPPCHIYSQEEECNVTYNRNYQPQSDNKLSVLIDQLKSSQADNQHQMSTDQEITLAAEIAVRLY